MSRDEAKKQLLALGVSEVSEEAITNFLNTLNSAVKTEKERADRLSKEAEKVSALQTQLDELNNKGLSEVEKANKLTEQANSRIAELEKSLKAMETEKKLAELGIVGDDAKNLFGENGELNFETLGQVISAREKKAATEKETELAGKAGNPGGTGSSGTDGGETKTEAETFAENYAKSVAANNKASNDALASYLK